MLVTPYSSAHTADVCANRPRSFVRRSVGPPCVRVSSRVLISFPIGSGRTELLPAKTAILICLIAQPIFYLAIGACNYRWNQRLDARLANGPIVEEKNIEFME